MILETTVTASLPELDNASMEKLVSEIGDVMLDEIRLNFGEGGRPVKWAGLKSGKGPSFLFDTGDLLQSLEMVTGQESEYYFARVQTDVEYAEYHQFGTEKMVSRPFMVLPPEAMQRIMTLAAGKVVEILNSEKPKHISRENEF